MLSLCPCGDDTLSKHPDHGLPELVPRVGGRDWKRGERDSWGVLLQCLGEDQNFLESPPVTGSAQTGFRLDRETSEAIEGGIPEPAVCCSRQAEVLSVCRALWDSLASSVTLWPLLAPLRSWIDVSCPQGSAGGSEVTNKVTF